jgi:hypothetical protein
MTKTMLAVGRTHRMPDRDQIDEGRNGIEQRVDQARQQCDGPGFEPGHEFGGDQ